MTLNLCENGDRWWCFVRGCHAEVRLQKDTWLDNSNLSFRKVVLLCYCWSKESTSINFASSNWALIKTANLLANRVVIGEPHTALEVVGACFLEEKLSGVPVTTTRENFRETRECFVYTVPDSGAATLLPIIQRSIRPGTTMMSGLWVACRGIQAMGYTDLTINHIYEIFDPVPGSYTEHREFTAKRQTQKQRATWDTPQHA